MMLDAAAAAMVANPCCRRIAYRMHMSDFLITGPEKKEICKYYDKSQPRLYTIKLIWVVLGETKWKKFEVQ